MVISSLKVIFLLNTTDVCSRSIWGYGFICIHLLPVTVTISHILVMNFQISMTRAFFTVTLFTVSLFVTHPGNLVQKCIVICLSLQLYVIWLFQGLPCLFHSSAVPSIYFSSQIKERYTTMHSQSAPKMTWPWTKTIFKIENNLTSYHSFSRQLFSGCVFCFKVSETYLLWATGRGSTAQ